MANLNAAGRVPELAVRSYEEVTSDSDKTGWLGLKWLGYRFHHYVIDKGGNIEKQVNLMTQDLNRVNGIIRDTLNNMQNAADAVAQRTTQNEQSIVTLNQTKASIQTVNALQQQQGVLTQALDLTRNNVTTLQNRLDPGGDIANSITQTLQQLATVQTRLNAGGGIENSINQVNHNYQALVSRLDPINGELGRAINQAGTNVQDLQQRVHVLAGRITNVEMRIEDLEKGQNGVVKTLAGHTAQFREFNDHLQNQNRNIHDLDKRQKKDTQEQKAQLNDLGNIVNLNQTRQCEVEKQVREHYARLDAQQSELAAQKAQVETQSNALHVQSKAIDDLNAQTKVNEKKTEAKLTQLEEGAEYLERRLETHTGHLSSLNTATENHENRLEYLEETSDYQERRLDLHAGTLNSLNATTKDHAGRIETNEKVVDVLEKDTKEQELRLKEQKRGLTQVRTSVKDTEVGISGLKQRINSLHNSTDSLKASVRDIEIRFEQRIKLLERQCELLQQQIERQKENSIRVTAELVTEIRLLKEKEREYTLRALGDIADANLVNTYVLANCFSVNREQQSRMIAQRALLDTGRSQISISSQTPLSPIVSSKPENNASEESTDVAFSNNLDLDEENALPQEPAPPILQGAEPQTQTRVGRSAWNPLRYVLGE